MYAQYIHILSSTVRAPPFLSTRTIKSTGGAGGGGGEYMVVANGSAPA